MTAELDVAGAGFGLAELGPIVVLDWAIELGPIVVLDWAIERGAAVVLDWAIGAAEVEVLTVGRDGKAVAENVGSAMGVPM